MDNTVLTCVGGPHFSSRHCIRFKGMPSKKNGTAFTTFRMPSTDDPSEGVDVTASLFPVVHSNRQKGAYLESGKITIDIRICLRSRHWLWSNNITDANGYIRAAPIVRPLMTASGVLPPAVLFSENTDGGSSKRAAESNDGGASTRKVPRVINSRYHY